MRIIHTPPTHITLGVDTQSWSRLVKWSHEAIEWLSNNDEALDTLFVFPYTATSCALIQYHTWSRRRDPLALESLKLVRTTALKWEASVQPGKRNSFLNTKSHRQIRCQYVERRARQ